MNNYFGLHNLVPSSIFNKKKKRLGRGEGGKGKTCGRGNKGQKARKSGNVRVGFEGGQNPLYKRLPKYKFNNFFFKKIVSIINLKNIKEKYSEGELVDKCSLLRKGLIKKGAKFIKILGDGELNFKLKFYINYISNSAREKIIKSGGRIIIMK